MAFNLVDEIRKKSREEWLALPKEKLTELRIWIQENSEKAFGVGIAAGVILILAFNLVLTIAVLAAACFGVICLIARPAGSSTGGGTTPPPADKTDDSQMH